jgi:hypothetical protein
VARNRTRHREARSRRRLAALVRRGILTLPLVLALSAVAQAQQNPTPAYAQLFLDAWERCVSEKAKRYATSPDSTEFIVKVATRACDEQRNAMGAALARSGEPVAVQQTTLNSLEQQITQAAAEAILEARSKR